MGAPQERPQSTALDQSTPWWSGHAGSLRYVRLAVLIGSLAGFVVHFQPYVSQWLVDGLWLLAIALWVFEVRQVAGTPFLDLHVTRPQVAPIAALIGIFAVAWLPFYDNWRWAYTGDSIGEYAGVVNFARQPQNILSIHGVDDTITWLHLLTYNCFMFLFEPTFFWHRAGKLLISCCALAAIYTYFTLVLGRWWALALAACVVTNYVWLWFSYVSYEFIDSYVFYFLSLAVAQLIWWHPDRLGLWMLCGLVGGLSLFFSQPAWSAVAAVGLVLGVFALKTCRLTALVLYAISFLLVGVPIFLQGIPGNRAARLFLDWTYLRSVFMQVLRLPYTSTFRHIGILEGFLRWPLSELYVVGAVVAGLGAVPLLRRKLRLPPVAPVLLALLLWDAVLLTLTNNGYGTPSSKRAYNLIPLQLFFALLPFYLLFAWCKGQRVLRAAAGIVTGAAMCVYAVGSLSVILHPIPHLYGDNSLDGLIELRQRFADRKVVFFTSREVYVRDLVPKGFFDNTYHLMDQVVLESDFSDAAVDRACASRSILCTEPAFESERFDQLSRRSGDGFTPFELLNSSSLVCYECGSL